MKKKTLPITTTDKRINSLSMFLIILDAKFDYSNAIPDSRNKKKCSGKKGIGRKILSLIYH